VINLTKTQNLTKGETMNTPQYTKAVISNRLVEVTHQSFIPLVGRTSRGGRKPATNQNIDNYRANKKTSINRAKKKIRRLLECNFTDYYAFLTLTFRSSESVDVTDIKQCNKMFTDFKKRLDYHLKKNNLPNFKYLGVIEFQDENRQGAVHYHIVCNLTEITSDILQQLWQYGLAHKAIATSDEIQNAKIAFYLNKGITDPRLNGNKRYFHSHSLIQPIIHEVKNIAEFYDHLNGCYPTLKEGNTYESQYTGETKYEQYYLKNAKELIEYVQEF
jgi:hypothetical protein